MKKRNPKSNTAQINGKDSEALIEHMHKLTPEEESKIIAGISAMFDPAPSEGTLDEFGLPKLQY